MYIFFCRSASFFKRTFYVFGPPSPRLRRTAFAFAIKLFKNFYIKAFKKVGLPAEALRENWGEWWGSNPRHPGPQPGALPTELHPPYQTAFNYTVL